MLSKIAQNLLRISNRSLLDRKPNDLKNSVSYTPPFPGESQEGGSPAHANNGKSPKHRPPNLTRSGSNDLPTQALVLDEQKEIAQFCEKAPPQIDSDYVKKKLDVLLEQDAQEADSEWVVIEKNLSPSNSLAELPEIHAPDTGASLMLQAIDESAADNLIKRFTEPFTKTGNSSTINKSRQQSKLNDEFSTLPESEKIDVCNRLCKQFMRFDGDAKKRFLAFCGLMNWVNHLPLKDQRSQSAADLVNGWSGFCSLPDKDDYKKKLEKTIQQFEVPHKEFWGAAFFVKGHKLALNKSSKTS